MRMGIVKAGLRRCTILIKEINKAIENWLWIQARGIMGADLKFIGNPLQGICRSNSGGYLGK